MDKTPGEVVVTPLFRRGAALQGVPEIPMIAPRKNRPAAVAPTTAVDLSGQAKLWFLIGPGGAGKTAVARWLFWRMTEQGRDAVLAALDPTNRSLASWFAGVEQPPTNDGAQTARWLREFLEYLMAGQDRSRLQPAILDFGGGDTALERVAGSASDLHQTLEDAGFGVVACYVLTPRVDDLTHLVDDGDRRVPAEGDGPPVERRPRRPDRPAGRSLRHGDGAQRFPRRRGAGRGRRLGAGA
jgi:hypothetical protein